MSQKLQSGRTGRHLLIVLDRNLFQPTTDEITIAPVNSTIIDDAVVYERESGDPTAYFLAVRAGSRRSPRA
jgi:hypothetical protein